MNKIAYFAFLSIVAFGLHASAPNYPFPTYATNMYYSTVIVPTNVSKSMMAAKIETLYTQWKEDYLRTVPYATDQMYVYYNADGTSEPTNAVSVSEGQGYGMMLAAYMAGYDADAQTIFDSLYRFCLAFPAPSPIH